LLPDDATLEDIQYRIYVRQAIDAGLREATQGRTLSQEEVEQRVARWIGK
jgi:predicted transcriptional regulator